MSPVNANLAMGLVQQFYAVGTYSDGSAKPLTEGVTWSSTAPGVASVTSSGMVSAISQGSTSITAASGSLSGNTNVVVNTSTGGLVVVNDLTDSQIVIARNSDQSTLTFFGSRDSSGNPTLLTGVQRVAPDGTWQNLTFDAQGRPTAIIMSDNTQFYINWTSATGAVLTRSTADGGTVVSAPIGSAVFSNASVAAASESAEPQAGSTTPPNTTVSLKVSTCHIPENNADAVVIGGGPAIPAFLTTPNSSGGSVYQANLPSGLATTAASLLQALPPYGGPACSFVTDFENAMNGTPYGGPFTLQGAICLAMQATALLQPEALPLATYACGTAGTIVTQVINAVCTIAQHPDELNSFITFFTDPVSVFWQVQLRGFSTGNPVAATGIVAQLPFPGGYPAVYVNLDCPNLGSVKIIPSAASIPPSQPFSLIATGFGPDDKAILSSSIISVWNSANVGVATLSSIGQQLPEDTWNFVTGQSSALGQTTQITATEQRTQKTATSNVTVIGCAANGTWTGGFTGSNGTNGTVNASLNESAGAISGTVTVNDNKGTQTSSVTGTDSNGVLTFGPVTVDGATVSANGTFAASCEITGTFIKSATKTLAGTYALAKQ